MGSREWFKPWALWVGAHAHESVVGEMVAILKRAECLGDAAWRSIEIAARRGAVHAASQIVSPDEPWGVRAACRGVIVWLDDGAQEVERERVHEACYAAARLAADAQEVSWRQQKEAAAGMELARSRADASPEWAEKLMRVCQELQRAAHTSECITTAAAEAAWAAWAASRRTPEAARWAVGATACAFDAMASAASSVSTSWSGHMTPLERAATISAAPAFIKMCTECDRVDGQVDVLH
jgi:hypothetical protein